MYIVREGLTPEQALLIEAALISVLDWQLGGALTNQVSGHGTTHFGLKTVQDLEATKGEPFRIADLPGLAELKGAGLLENNLPPDFTVPEPTDASALMADELPLEAGDEEGPPTLFSGDPHDDEGTGAA